MNTQAITDWLKAGGAWTIVAILSYLLNASRPFIQELPKYMRSKRFANRIKIVDSYATNAITTVASFTNLSNDERKAKAVSIVANNLTKHSINISANEISNMVENAYTVAKNHGLKDAPTKQTSNNDQTANQQAQQVNSVINPQPVNNQNQQNTQQNDSTDEKAKQLAQQVQNNPKAQSLLREMNGNGQSK